MELAALGDLGLVHTVTISKTFQLLKSVLECYANAKITMTTHVPFLTTL